jgi:hypothetical protein
VGVAVYIDDDTGQTYRAWFGSDSKRFAQLLIHTRFWGVLEEILPVVTRPLTFIVAEQAVRDELTHLYPSWDIYHASRFQSITPLIQTLEGIHSVVSTDANWLGLLQQKWLEEQGFEHYHYDDYFAEEGFQSDLDSLLKRLRAIKQSGASEVCIYLL